MDFFFSMGIVFLFRIGKRTLLDSLSTFETQLNRALEQNALLENELDEKQQVFDEKSFFEESFNRFLNL
jgi:hypothetical protein